MITLAISKGRIFQDTLPLLKKIGCAPDEKMLKSRSLIIRTENKNVRLIIVRAQDTPTFVACGAAAAGVAGSDVLSENPFSSVYQQIDLKIATCRMVVAAPPATNVCQFSKKITIATKYPHCTQRFFNEQGISANLIKLHGTIEVAPFVRLADAIVDLSDTGNTLKAHGLEEKLTIQPVSARFITNKVAERSSKPLALLQARIQQAILA